ELAELEDLRGAAVIRLSVLLRASRRFGADLVDQWRALTRVDLDLARDSANAAVEGAHAAHRAEVAVVWVAPIVEAPRLVGVPVDAHRGTDLRERDAGEPNVVPDLVDLTGTLLARV